MFGFCRRTRPLRIAVLAIYSAFSLFGSSLHAWSHHHSGPHSSCCSDSSDRVGKCGAVGCDELPTAEHGLSCHHHAAHHGNPVSHESSGSSQAVEASPSGDRVETCSSIGMDRAVGMDRTSIMGGASGSHGCAICDQIASLMQSWGASDWSLQVLMQSSDSVSLVADCDIAVGIYMARSRAPPSRV